MDRFFLSCLLWTYLSLVAFAQQPIGEKGESRLYQEALLAFQNEDYQLAADFFQQYVDNKGMASVEAAYYLAFSRLKTGNDQGAKELEDFVKVHANHPLAQTGYFLLGNQSFANGEFNQALIYYNKVHGVKLSITEREEWTFRKGYILVRQQQYTKATETLEQAIEYRGHHFYEVSYYLGHLYYDQENYVAALNTLKPIDKPGRKFSDQISALIGSCYYQQKMYSALYQYAEDRLVKGANETTKSLCRLTGEAYFSQKKYRQAAHFLQRYVDFEGGRAPADIYYKLGLSYFQTEDDTRSIDYLKLAGLAKGDFGQLSSFYLGQLYLRKGNVDYAYSAFSTVIQNGTDVGMKEEAMFLVGKISYQRQQYAEAITHLQNFLQYYPKSVWAREADELLATAYLNTSNYDQAIGHLESINNKSNVLKKAYQKVTFRRGQLLYNDGDFANAAQYLEKSVLFPTDKDIAGEAYFLLGETYVQLQNNDKAVSAYQLSQSRFPTSTWSLYSEYGIGYIYYNQKAFDKAKIHFERFVQKVNRASDYYLDANLRLADCYYVRKEYRRAIELYNVVMSQTGQYRDYIYYQLGLIYGLSDDTERSRSFFEKLTGDHVSAYADNALVQMSQSYIEEARFKEAVPYLDKLISGYPDSNLVPYARSKRALCNFNLGAYRLAKNDYLYILDNNLNHPVANSALLGLQEVQKKGERVPNFEKYMTDYQRANPDDESLEVIAFETAKNYYYNQEYKKSITSLQLFMDKYPNSSFAEDAIYYLADSHFRLNNWSLAVEYFDLSAQFPNTVYLTRALDKKGKAMMALNKFESAVSNYRDLIRKGRTPKDQYLAYEGLMNAYLALENGDSSLYYADQILDSDWKPANAEIKVWITKGKIFLNKKDYDTAQDAFIKVVNESRNEQGAEASYYMAMVFFERMEFKRSLELLFELNRDFASYPNWVGKSFLLIAENYMSMGELLQAKATLNSVIEHSTVPGIVELARKKLEYLEVEQQKVLVQDSTKISD